MYNNSEKLVKELKIGFNVDIKYCGFKVDILGNA